ncbi:integral membrane sensor signal transduction histidine kinase [Scytonema sp. HK-05]|uniref:sensor histidine kinase n=1 Tax=Scytonema sp. HK-05 TaxID=1137095 RepID=UPI0009376036|nr:sensor histidine kinase [Scytonema sp. HK-05]OKH46287.1 sensor histidine kinase [Scytonema sp. HK-05]BAY49171.1 integral membrane sensor signal transduction histidine kinase [Scytonema sp. HK-05]
MNAIATTSSIRRTLQYVEWTLLVVYFFLMIVNRPEDIYASQVIPTYVILASLSISTLLSFLFPINRPIWQRRAYILLEILPIMSARAVNWRLDILLYLVLTKSCFLLRRKEIVITAIATGILWNVVWLGTLSSRIEFDRAHVAERIARLYDVNSMIIRNIINDTSSYLAASTFVILFAFVIIAEQKSRQKAEVLTQQVETLAATLERTRIAREIHDSLGHSLTTLDVQLELAQKLYQRDPIQAAKSLDIAKDLTNQCLTEVRRSVQTMRQTNFNLNEALSTLVEQVGRNQAFVIQLDVQLPQLPVQTSHQLYCIVQEGLTNIQKHASATVVSLKGYQTSNAIILKLTDNGQGFEASAPHTGFGLRGMHERVHILGGELKIKSSLGEGTQIQAIIPL